MATNMSPSCHLLHHLRRPHPPRSPPLPSTNFVSRFFKPLSASPPSAVAAAAVYPPVATTSSPKSLLQTLASAALFSSGPLTAPVPHRSISSAAFPQTPSPHLGASLDGDDEEEEILDINDEDEEEGEEGEDEEEEELGEGIVSMEEEVPEPEGGVFVRPVSTKKPLGLSLNLSVKEKKELVSYAHSLGDKLKSQLVGKSGVTDSVAAAFIENLESNELLKIKIHRTCPGELEDVVNQLETLTGSVAVGQIGRTVIIYRPSLTKLKAEEKKKQNQRLIMKKRLKPRPAFERTGPASRSSARPRYGRSRV